jgi:2-methylisocitrate lyase-like PEP mutase family enzyme
MAQKQTTALRELLAGDECVVAPGSYDAFTARLVQKAGFPATYFSMWAHHTTQLGLPHLGVTTMTEFAEHCARIVAAIDIPLLVDAEHGFGGVFETQRAMRLFERAGVAGVHIHDQTRGQGWMLRTDDKTAGLVDYETYGNRIAAAKDAVSDPDFVIIGRTESTRISSEEAIRRSNVAVEAGADLAMPMLSPWLYYGRPHPAPREELHAIIKSWQDQIKAPIVLHSPFGIDFTPDELTKLGVGMWVIPQATLGYAAAGARDALAALKAGTLPEHNKEHPHVEIGAFAQVADQASFTAIAQKYGS